MKSFKSYMIVGTVFVLILGTLAHYFYDFSGRNWLVGLFAPVNESTWEHMKLLFFPMLLYTIYLVPKFQKEYPCVLSAMLFGTLAGSVLIPILFYTYSGILGYNVLLLDIAVFILSVFFAFYTAYQYTISCRMQSQRLLLCGIIFISILCFLIFTYHPPVLGLFAVPAI